MNLKLTKKENDFLKKLDKKIMLNDKNNIAFASTVHIVYIESERPLDKESDTINGVIPKYKINENVFENIEEIKCLLKENVFENVFKIEQNEPLKPMFYLDNKSELFTICVTRPQGFKEIKAQIINSFKEIDLVVKDFDSLLKYISSYYKSNDFYLENFPKYSSFYEVIYYEVVTVPYALFNKKIDANKCKKILERKGEKVKIESYATKDKKSDLAILREILIKLIQSAKEDQ